MSVTHVSQPSQGIKQCCDIERAQVRKAVAQENHSLYALLAFLRLEVEKLRKESSWYQAKLPIIRRPYRLIWLILPIVLS